MGSRSAEQVEVSCCGQQLQGRKLGAAEVIERAFAMPDLPLCPWVGPSARAPCSQGSPWPLAAPWWLKENSWAAEGELANGLFPLVLT